MSTSYPGVMPITQTSFANGAGNARDSAAQSQTDMNNRQQMINQAGQGRRRKHKRHQKRKGGANTDSAPVAVPQFQMQYTPTGGPGTNPNDQIASASSTGMQSAAWSANDSQATNMSGGRKSRKGGNPDWVWGCYSGGKTKRRHSRKTRRHRNKSRRHRRR